MTTNGSEFDGMDDSVCSDGDDDGSNSADNLFQRDQDMTNDAAKGSNLTDSENDAIAQGRCPDCNSWNVEMDELDHHANYTYRQRLKCTACNQSFDVYFRACGIEYRDQ